MDNEPEIYTPFLKCGWKSDEDGTCSHPGQSTPECHQFCCPIISVKENELTEHIAQDELAFKQMIHANTRLTEDVKRLTAELEQCKHALDDEGEDLDAAMCKCGHPLREHRHGECIEQQPDGYICECNNFEVAK